MEFTVHIRPRRLAGTFLAGALLAVLPGACATSDADDAQGIGRERSRVGAPQPVGESLVGNYLAGRHAQANRDVGSASDFMARALAHDPDNPDLIRRAFVLMAADGRMVEAVKLAERLLTHDEADTFSNLVLAADGIKSGRFDAAVERLDSLPDSGLGVLMGPVLKAWALVGAGKTEPGLKALALLVKDDKFRTIHDLHAGLINDLAGNGEAAEKAYISAAERQESPTLRMTELIGNYYERSGRPDEAGIWYDRYAKNHPNTDSLDPILAGLAAGKVPAPLVATVAHGAAEALFGVASSVVRREGRDTALVFGRMALDLKPSFPMMQILLASILEDEERLEEANAIFAAIDRRSSFSWTARLHMATNLDRLDRTGEAEKQLRVMASERKDDPRPMIDLGDILRRRERFKEAAQAYDDAVARVGELEPGHWSLLYSRGMALERSDQWDRAEKDFLKALEFEPDQPYVLNYLGYSWVEKGMHLDQAQDMIRKAVKERPTDGYIVDSLGWVYYRLGKFEKATRELERAVELRPEDPVINDHLGDAYWRVGRRAEAHFQWRRALSLDPEPDLIPKINAKLKNGLPARKKEDLDG